MQRIGLISNARPAPARGPVVSAGQRCHRPRRRHRQRRRAGGTGGHRAGDRGARQQRHGRVGRRHPDRLAALRRGASLALHDLATLTSLRTGHGIRVVVCGHSHRPRIEERDGVLYVNPGSAGPRRFRLPVSVAEMMSTAHRSRRASSGSHSCRAAQAAPSSTAPLVPPPQLPATFMRSPAPSPTVLAPIVVGVGADRDDAA